MTQKNNSQNSWDINENEFYKLSSLKDQITFCLKYSVLAPSTHNSQPWRFKVFDNRCEIYLDKNKRLPYADPTWRDMYISIGCAIQNLIMAANYFDIYKNVTINNSDKNLVAVFYFKNRSNHRNNEYKKTIESILNWKNTRGIFKNEKISESLENQIKNIPNPTTLNFNLITNNDQITKIAELTAEGIKLAYADKNFREEASDWINNSLSSKKEGIPGYSLKMPLLLSFIFPFIIRKFNIGNKLSKLNYISVRSAPMICVISSETENKEQWVKVGMLAQTIMLTCRNLNLTTSIFVAAVEMGDLKTKTKNILGLVNYPQFIFCIGYMPGKYKQTPRISVNNKLYEN